MPVPAQGKMSDVGSGRGRSYRVNAGVEALGRAAVGGGAWKNASIWASLPVLPIDPPDAGGNS
jgi:hypothetical protein